MGTSAGDPATSGPSPGRPGPHAFTHYITDLYTATFPAALPASSDSLAAAERHTQRRPAPNQRQSPSAGAAGDVQHAHRASACGPDSAAGLPAHAAGAAGEASGTPLASEVHPDLPISEAGSPASTPRTGGADEACDGAVDGARALARHMLGLWSWMLRNASGADVQHRLLPAWSRCLAATSANVEAGCTESTLLACCLLDCDLHIELLEVRDTCTVAWACECLMLPIMSACALLGTTRGRHQE